MTTVAIDDVTIRFSRDKKSISNLHAIQTALSSEMRYVRMVPSARMAVQLGDEQIWILSLDVGDGVQPFSDFVISTHENIFGSCRFYAYRFSNGKRIGHYAGYDTLQAAHEWLCTLT